MYVNIYLWLVDEKIDKKHCNDGQSILTTFTIICINAIKQTSI